MNKFAVYNASAGSGKTFTLVKEYLKIALGSDVDTAYKNILAVTFTNKAASEMKERVIGALQSLSGQKPLEGTPKFLMEELIKPFELGGVGVSQEQIIERSKRVLKSILHNYSSFSIGTIDKFTHKIIRTFAHDLHLPLNFDIELNENEVLEKSIDSLIAQIGVNEKLTTLLVEYAGKKADDESSWHVDKDLKEFSKNLLKEDGELHLQQLRNLSIDDFNSIKDYLKEEGKKLKIEINEYAKQTILLVEEFGIDSGSFTRGFYIKYWEEIINKERYKPTEGTSKIFDEGLDWYSKSKKQLQKDLIDANKHVLIERYQTSRKIIEKIIINSLLYKNIYNLAVLNEIEKTIQEYKKDNSVLSITDFNKKIAKIVASEPAPFIYERLGEKYKHYLIDEFQDTSIIQWHNLIPLLDNSLSENNFSMIVGDAKQAIYRFRGGEVDQIIKLPYLHNDNNNQLIKEREATFIREYIDNHLESNYRSKAEIVDFNNHFFRFLSNNLSSNYKNIYDNLSQKFNPENKGGGVGIDFIGFEGKEEYDALTFKRIEEIIEFNTSPEKRYRLEDIAILVRDNKEGSLIASQLLEKGIPVISSESLLLNNSSEVRFLLSFFNYLAYPNETSFQLPIINYLINNKFKSNTLIKIYNSKNNKSLESFLRSNNSEIDNKKISNYSLYELVEYLIKHFNLNQEVNVYLQFFLDKIQEYSSKYDNSIVNFLEWWSNKGAKFSIVIPEGINAVKVMSIHKSKGLEFPIVIYPYAYSSSNNSEDYAWVDDLEVENLKTSIIPINKELIETKYAGKYKNENDKSKLDLINVLYVALTRPEDKLYILTQIYKPPKKTSSDAINISKLLDAYCSQYPENKTEEGSYVFGNLNTKVDKKVVKGANNQLIENVEYNNWREKIMISFQAPEVWETEYLEEAAEYGKLIHKILSEINVIEDLDVVVEKYLNNGVISSKEAKEISLEIKNILSLNDVKPFFTDVDRVMNETSILLPSGSSYKPDRVVMKNNETIIIDYKTGNKEQSHLKQLANYQSILLEMGYKNIKSYLLYLKEKELVRL